MGNYDSSLTVRTNGSVKREAQKIYSDLGLDLSSAINVFLKKSIEYGGFPFEVRAKTPNERLLEALTDGPRKTFRLEGRLRTGDPADLVLLETETPYLIDSSTFLSKGRSTPFDGWEVSGRTLLTLKDGKTVYSAL